MKREHITIEQLKWAAKAYQKDLMSLADLSRELKVSKQGIHYLFKRYGIKTRSRIKGHEVHFDKLEKQAKKAGKEIKGELCKKRVRGVKS